MSNRVKVVVTGTGWMGSGFGSIDSALDRLFASATNEISICAYSISSGAEVILERIESTLQRNVEVCLIINKVDKQEETVRKKLNDLLISYARLRIYNFQPREGDGDLHAKVIVIDRSQALVGSSNFSRRGLLRNHELGVIVEGNAAAEVARTLDLLITSGQLERVYSLK